ncbi:DUF397 domain-containing protein [Actinophytocola sp.]|uniref:DUF397 domain-containing protein n=1 Tax=Actinophytocola sp. TaxID=1872138 RepID=UPI002ED02F43
MAWRKSSFSGSNGGSCVEVANTLDALRDSKNPGSVLAGRVDLLVARVRSETAWRKSSFSGSNGGDCVEVAATLRAVRDSKNPGSVLAGRVDLLVASVKKLP